MQVNQAAVSRPLIVVITSYAESLHNFRGDLIREFLARGYRVAALAPDYTDASRSAIEALGAEAVSIGLERNGMNVLSDLGAMLALRRLLTRLRPAMTFCYFMKPVIYGTIAAWLSRVPKRIAMVAGLGYVFTDNGDEKSLRIRLIRLIVLTLYGIAFRLNHRVLLQNCDDRQYLVDRWSLPEGKGALVNGSGVNLDRFPVAERPDERRLTFVWTGRLLKEKGVHELVAAVKIVRAQGSDIRMIIVGGVDGNPGSLNRHQMQAWVDQGLIEWPGKVPDVRPYLNEADVFVLPSYREGVPRSTQEAMATGLAVITTDVPGCRETVDDGRNGFLVTVRDAQSIADAMLRYVAEPGLARAHGTASRMMVEERFDVHVINAKMLALMGI